MKNSIMRRLLLYFAIVLILFAFIVGIFFAVLFSGSVEKMFQDDLEFSARSIAESVSNLPSNEDVVQTQDVHGRGHNSHGHKNKHGHQRHASFIDEIAASDVWVVDANATIIDKGQEQDDINYAQLPESVPEVVQTVFANGNTTTIKRGSIFKDQTLITGAPVIDARGEVISVVVLHTQTQSAKEAIRSGLRLLLGSLAVALILTTVLAIFLSRHFITPLKKMERTTQQLVKGDYSAQSDVRLSDEIGSLAKNIDLLANKLDLASQKSADLERQRREFISSISHELRTPITVMRGSVEALADGVISEEKVEEYYKQILNESIQLERLINDLLELTRLQNPSYSVEKEYINMPDIVDDAVRSMRQIAKEKQIEITYKKNVERFPVYADYVRIRQMLMIVLDNAIKFSNIGQTVQCVCSVKNDDLVLEIIDNGEGIAKEDLPNIFGKWFHVGKEQTEGTGLGLAIAKEIAQRHDIKIDIESVLDKGTTFIFIIPHKKPPIK